MQTKIQSLIYQIKRPYHFIKTGLLQGIPAQIKYHFPANKLKTITITGTDGKTTSSTLLYHILNTANKKTGLISTVCAKIGKEQIETGLHTTSPEPLQLNQLLHKMVKQNCEYAVLEMTSHGTYQFRDWGLKPIIAGLTNITHEHLDYFVNYDHYLKAKSLILKKANIAVINQDDQSFYPMRQHLNLNKQKIESYSLDEDLPSNINEAIKKRFPEKYNHSNARLATKIAQLTGVKDIAITKAITSFEGVPGRMQEIKLPSGKNGFRIIVDFAHTPNAIFNALSALKEQLATQDKKGRLIALFGSAGKRDISKRPAMGRAASKIADLVVMTADDPRTEDIWSIINQLKSGIEQGHNKIISIPDRYQAIKYTLTQLAQPGDIVALLGKGVEKSMAIGKKETPWSDEIVAKDILKGKNNKKKTIKND